MPKVKLIPFLIAIVAVATVLYTFFGNETQPQVSASKLNGQPYLSKITAQRKQKNNYLKISKESPMVNKSEFDSLVYFEPDIAYRIPAEIVPYEGADNLMKVPMTDGSTETYEKFGYARFSLFKKMYKLLIVRQGDGFSILFRDQTAPTETYGGGRYIDFVAADISNGLMMLDFNTAYNPYCAYNPSFACPLPPEQNRMDATIRAGEKNYVGKH